MVLVADESIERQIVERLRKDGHELYSIAEVEPGICDDDVLSRANERNAVLLTGDKDFGELVYRRGQAHTGIVLFRLSGLGPDEKAVVAALAIGQYASQLPLAFTVITPVIVRIRRPS